MEVIPTSRSLVSPLQATLRPLDVRSTTFRGVRRPAFRLDAAFYRKDFEQAEARVRSSGQAVRKLSTMASAFVPGRVRLLLVDRV